MDSSSEVATSSPKPPRSSTESSVRGGSGTGSGTGSGAGYPSGAMTMTMTSSKRYNSKANTACETCRLKKVKCNEGQPICSYCNNHGFHCNYRLRPKSSNEQVISTVLKQLNQVQEKLNRLESALQNGHPREIPQAPTTAHLVAPNTPIATPSPPRKTGSQFLKAADQAWFHFLPDSPIISDRAADNCDTPLSFSEETVKSRYAARSPWTCEEDRPLLPDLTGQSEPTERKDIMPWLEHYLEYACPMYPVMCDPSAHTISGWVTAQGFGEDIESCFTLLIVALSKAYKDEDFPDSGVSDFQRATYILSRVSVQFRIKHVQARILSAIFLLKKGRLLDFWHSLHAACTMLYTMLRRDETSGAERTLAERNNIRRIYWICYNFERDVKNEIDSTLPQSPLHQLEDSLPLPLGCDEMDLSHLSVRLRITLTFFLAEMSLKAIAERITTTANLEFYIQDAESDSIEVSPLLQELERQLDEWIERIPSFLGWSHEPGKGISSPLSIRVKLMYWFVRFSLFRPLILRVLHDSNRVLPILGWTLFREGLQAGLTLVTVTVLEPSDIDVIMGNRVLSTICLIKETVSRGYFPAVRNENVNMVLQAGIDVLWSRLAQKSEWIKCRLYNL